MELSSDQILLGLLWYVIFTFSTTCHEAAHALAALKLGDPTAYHGGQVTLNPLPHIQRAFFGMVVLPLVSFFAYGWMLGFASAPYDPQWALRYPKRSAWMALAGPAANLSIVVLAALGIRAGMLLGWLQAPAEASFSSITAIIPDSGAPEVLASGLSIAFSLNLLLCFFNLLPVPPLDGSGALPLVMNESTARRYLTFLWTQPMLGWLGILVAWRAFDEIFSPLFNLGLNLLYPGAGYGPA